METPVRHLALEFLVSIVEASPAMCRKIGGGDSPGSSPPLGAVGDGSLRSVDGMMSGDDEEAGEARRQTFAARVIPLCFSMMTELPVRFC